MSKAISSNRVFINGDIIPATILFNKGIITDIVSKELSPENCLDYGDLLIMPGLVDTHVHINEPGRTDWEGF